MCCWYTEIVDFTLPSNANENPILNKTLITMKYMGLPYQVGDSTRICMNNWHKIYGIGQNDAIPDDHTYTDPLGVQWRSYCDTASRLIKTASALSLAVLISSS